MRQDILQRRPGGCYLLIRQDYIHFHNSESVMRTRKKKGEGKGGASANLFWVCEGWSGR